MSPRKKLDLGFDDALKRAARGVEQRGTKAVAGTTPLARAAGSFRPATAKRSATVRKTLRLDADLIERFESLESAGDTPPLTRLVERWLREYLEAR